jgi:hypothetical protein
MIWSRAVVTIYLDAVAATHNDRYGNLSSNKDFERGFLVVETLGAHFLTRTHVIYLLCDFWYRSY